MVQNRRINSYGGAVTGFIRSLLSAGYGNAIEIGGAGVDSSVKNLCKIKGGVP